MEILEKAIAPDGTSLQIENWNCDYSFKPYGGVIGAYPKSLHSLNGDYAPRRNRTFRLALDFASYSDAKNAFESIARGKSTLNDYREHVRNKQLLECI
ncbi:hypothetical protein [Bacillus sp. FSL M8-0350]|uniref:hypothetical protein n=1 Tax=Bacillus sp. FSL M8-0350 TaxID=2954579 RepID=UPI00315AB575